MNLNERRRKLGADLQSDIAELMAVPILRNIAAGKAEPKLVWQVFSQYRHYCASFPQFLGALLARTTSPVARQPLVDNLWEESGSGDATKSHPAMLDKFLESWGAACGVSELPARSSDNSEPVKMFVEEILQVLETAPLPMAFGFLGPGTEEITSRQYNLILTGLRTYRLVDESVLDFFSTHITADIKHADVFWEALEEVATTESDWMEVERGARLSLELETKFWKEMTGLK